VLHCNPQASQYIMLRHICTFTCSPSEPAHALLSCRHAVPLSCCPAIPVGVLQTSSRSPLLAALHPLALIDVLSFAPSLLGALLPEYTIAPWGWDLRWFRVFRWGVLVGGWGTVGMSGLDGSAVIWQCKQAF
jgi:hypothetical protein